MSWIKKIFKDPRENGLNKLQFYFGLVLLLFAPIMSKLPTIILGEKVDAKAVNIVNKKLYTLTYLENKYTTWEAELSNGEIVQFEGTSNVVVVRGEVRTAFVNENNIEDGFIFSFAGFYNNFNSVVTILLMILWLSIFFVFGESDKAWLRVRTIKKWYLKVGAVVCVMFLFWYILILPVWLVFEVGWGGLFGYLLISLIISFQLKETIEYLIFSEDRLKEREQRKIEKRSRETKELNAEIMRRRKVNK